VITTPQSGSLAVPRLEAARPADSAAIADPEPLLAEWLEVLESLGRSESTLETYHRAVTDFCRRMDVCDLRQVTIEIVEKYLRRLYLLDRSVNLRRKHQYALRSFFCWLARRGVVPTDPTKGIPALRQKFMERISVFTREEIARLTIRHPTPPPPVRGRREPAEFFERRVEQHGLVEVRDRALLELMFDLGLRRGEPGLLERTDYDEAKGQLDIRNAKWQTELESFPVRDTTKAAMSVYLDALRRSPRWGRSKALFPAIGERRADTKRPFSGISAAAVYRILKRRIARAGIQARGRRLSPHAIRYTTATAWSENGVPIEHVRALMRHASVLTSQRYIRLGPIARIKRRADRSAFFRRFDSPDAAR
jgi:site-specific recombinase XerD